MNIHKKFLPPLLLFFLFPGLTYAVDWTDKKKDPSISIYIHNTYLHPDVVPITVKGVLKLGYGTEDACIPAVDAITTIIKLMPSIHDYRIQLDGVWAAYKFDLKYTCAQETFERLDNHRSYVIQYRLLHSALFYNQAIPSRHDVYFNY